MEAVWQATGIIANEMRMDVLTVSNMGANGASDAQARFWARVRQLSQFRSILNMIVLGEGEKYESRTGTVAGYKDLENAAGRGLAAVSGIPQVLLFGDTPSGLNTDGSSWQQAWARQVKNRQAKALHSPLLKLYTALFMAKKGPFKGKLPKSWSVFFNPIYEPTQGEIADVRYKNAQADTLYVQNGVLTADHVARSRFTDTGYGTEIAPYEDVFQLEDPAKEAAAREEIKALAKETMRAKHDPNVA
jgi:phage-related protein (TIGR01555 family)